jgi:hypothetical protein
VLASGAKGRTFKSCRARHFPNDLRVVRFLIEANRCRKRPQELHVQPQSRPFRVLLQGIEWPLTNRHGWLSLAILSQRSTGGNFRGRITQR